MTATTAIPNYGYANLLDVLDRACGDATGNPIEQGQAYAARATVIRLVDDVRTLMAIMRIDPTAPAAASLHAMLIRAGAQT